MFAYRSLVVGLLGACCLLLAMRPPAVVAPAPGRTLATAPAALQACASMVPTIVDVAPGVTAAQLPSLLHLLPDEQIVAVNDAPVASTLDAGVSLANIELARGRFLDVEVKSGYGARRVLVLLH
jgi:hypothetical protein